ncbi:MAG: dipeptidase [Sandaracinus sp.]
MRAWVIATALGIGMITAACGESTPTPVRAGDRVPTDRTGVDSPELRSPSPQPSPALAEEEDPPAGSGSTERSISISTSTSTSTSTTDTTDADAGAARWPLAIDTHIDTTQRMLDTTDDIADALDGGHVDFPRMRAGGLSGAFFSIWVDPRRYEGEAAWERARALVAAVRSEVERHPDQAALCTTATEVRAAHASGRIAVLMGIEGAHALGDAPVPTLIERLDELYGLGCRYLTITWTNDNVFAHASTGGHPARGLTEDGRTLITHMNELGMIPDVSHVSDRTFFDVLALSSRPPMASHSATRALSPHRRNVTDAMIRAMAEHHGVICVNYYAAFVDAAYGDARHEVEHAHAAELRAIEGRSWVSSGPRNALLHSLAPELHAPTIRALGAHFAHVVEIGGIETACLGSDFDGAGELAGLTDAADLPQLYAELERRGLALAPILGENVLRVLDANAPAP